jgi:hypothetical protein
MSTRDDFTTRLADQLRKAAGTPSDDKPRENTTRHVFAHLYRQQEARKAALLARLTKETPNDE